jgi:hypothetical protein
MQIPAHRSPEHHVVDFGPFLLILGHALTLSFRL